jgi:hypothetical protein
VKKFSCAVLAVIFLFVLVVPSIVDAGGRQYHRSGRYRPHPDKQQPHNHHRGYRDGGKRRAVDPVVVYGLVGGILTYKIVEGYLASTTAGQVIQSTERIRLEEIRAGVVTSTMGQEGTVLYGSPNGPTSLRASHDPNFAASAVTRVYESAAPRYERAELPLPSVDLRQLRNARAYMDKAGADDAEFAALARVTEEVSDPRRTYSRRTLSRDLVILGYLVRKFERASVPLGPRAALEDAIEYVNRGLR